MRRLLLVVLMAGWGCASAPVRPAPLDEALLSRADAELLAGCLDCLLRARDTYERLAAGPHRPTVLSRLFEAELLLTLRARELGFDEQESAARLRQLAAELPPTLEADRYIALIGAIPRDPVGTPRAERAAFLRANDAIARQVADHLAWLQTGGLRAPVREYLSYALKCSGWIRGPGAELSPAPDAPMLLLYRAGTCERKRDAVLLAGVRDAVPDFHEASYPLAQIHLAATMLGSESPAKAVAAAADAYGRFPESPGVAFIAGSVHQVTGDCEGALGRYDETIALAPRHEDAWLGRTACLSHLRRHDEAIESATRIIELGLDTRRDGYYWRAWNQHRLQRLTPARSDIDSAKRLGFTLEIRLLAGIIEYDQDDLDASEADMTAARSISGGRSCTAHWYLGLVRVRRVQWREAGGDFESAMQCYGQNVREGEGAIVRVEASDFEPDYKAARITALRAAIVEDTRQQRASAMNAAKGFANSGVFDKAAALGAIAAEDPSLAEDVGALNEFLAKSRSVVGR